MKKSFVLDTNKSRIVLNWACFYNWYDQDILESVAKTLKHYEEMEIGIIPDITTSGVRQRLKDYINKCITDKKYLQKELNAERKVYQEPQPKSLREFFKMQELPYKNTQDYSDFLELVYQGI